MGTDWDDVVTTALLGTDRRPLPPGLLPPSPRPDGAAAPGPTTLLLDHAARHRALTRAAGPLGRCPAPPCAPDDDRLWAPVAAQQLLDRLLARPVPELVNAWLAAAAARLVRPAPEYWTGLAALAATRPDVERGVLAQALGVQGVWFVAQNPAWWRLAETLGRPAPGPVQRAGAEQPVPREQEVRARPELALAVPAPWPRALTAAALRVLLGGQLGWGASRYGTATGARLAHRDRDLLQQALDVLREPGGPVRPGSRLVEEALLSAVAAADDRAALDRAFDGPPHERAGAPPNPEPA